jgi:hypothetical protein
MPRHFINIKLSSLGPFAICFINVVLLALLGWLDYVTGDYSLIIFYLVPVAIAAWYVNRQVGMLFCVFSFVTRLIADGAGSSFSFAYSPLRCWNVFVEFLFLLIMSLLISTLRTYMRK